MCFFNLFLVLFFIIIYFLFLLHWNWDEKIKQSAVKCTLISEKFMTVMSGCLFGLFEMYSFKLLVDDYTEISKLNFNCWNFKIVLTNISLFRFYNFMEDFETDCRKMSLHWMFYLESTLDLIYRQWFFFQKKELLFVIRRIFIFLKICIIIFSIV